jgi:hypothetical protein
LRSFDARKATFLLALILIASPVAGLRPMRAGRLRTCRMPSPVRPQLVALLEVLGDAGDEIVEDRLAILLRHAMRLGEIRRQLLQETVGTFAGGLRLVAMWRLHETVTVRKNHRRGPKTSCFWAFPGSFWGWMRGLGPIARVASPSVRRDSAAHHQSDAGERDPRPRDPGHPDAGTESPDRDARRGLRPYPGFPDPASAGAKPITCSPSMSRLRATSGSGIRRARRTRFPRC